MTRTLLLLALGLVILTLPAGCPAPDDGDDSGADRRLTGVINATENAKRSPRMESTDQRFSVLVEAVDTRQTYLGTTDPNGLFQVDIPATETSDYFMISVIMPDGQPAGPVIFGQSGGQGLTGLAIDGEVDLGDMPFPDDPTKAPIVPGADSTIDPNSVPVGIVARLNDDGVPVGVGEFGRGDDAKGDASPSTLHQLDPDQDGMTNLFDADDDGDGTVDDFDDDAVSYNETQGLNVHFFMNLKIDDVQATPYFSGDVPGIENSLKTQTVITFEVQGDAALSKNITAVRLINPPAPSPPYQSTMTVLNGTLWSTLSYALRPDGTNHFQEWAVPNDFMNTGDTFTVEVTFDDGSVGVYSRMVNYVFKSIPKLINVGPPGALAFFNGPKVITFDGTKDLAFEWAPPVDDFGMLLTGLPYRFEVFYYDANGAQINDIDDAATWPSPPANWANAAYEVSGAALTTLSGSNTFTVTLPKEIFPNQVTLSDSSTVNVASYKVDIAAQNNGNNAALMVRLIKS